MSTVVFQGTYPLVYTLGSGASYLNLYQAPFRWGGYKGAYVGVPNGGSLYTVLLTNEQIQQVGNAIRFHLATGGVNQTINGVQIVSSGTTSINVVVAAVSFTINLTNDQASALAQAALLYVSSGGPPSPHTEGFRDGN